MIDINLLKSLTPNCSIAHMVQTLGQPVIVKEMDFPIFENAEFETNSYIYFIENIFLKITSKDNLKIDTLTLLCRDFENKLNLSEYFQDSFELILNKTKIDDFFIQLTERDIEIRTLKDNTACIQFNLVNPFYFSASLFLYGDLTNYFESENKYDLLGTQIMGFCISEIKGNVFFIYDNEIKNLV